MERSWRTHRPADTFVMSSLTEKRRGFLMESPPFFGYNTREKIIEK